MPYEKSKTRCIGILTSGGDCPGLNAAIRGVVKPALWKYGMKVLGIMDGFRGLVENRTVVIDDRTVSGILTGGGTFLGTSRDKPHRMPMGGKIRDMTDTAVHNAKKLQIDCLVCLGGGGTQKNALRLHKAGLNVLTLPKTIDNDIYNTDMTFGFDTALTIATEAIDRLHTTATSHHRIIVLEIMGHKAGWLALGSGVAGGADVILIPEIPYNLESVAEHLLERRRGSKRFSIIAIAEGAMSSDEYKQIVAEKEAKDKEKEKKKKNGKKTGKSKKTSKKSEEQILAALENGAQEPDNSLIYHAVQESKASQLARSLQRLTGTEARVTSLGHVQRGGIPSATDRLLCTNLGTTAAKLLAEGRYNVMVAVKGDKFEAVPLTEVAGQVKYVPRDHEWVRAARMVGTCIGD